MNREEKPCYEEKFQAVKKNNGKRKTILTRANWCAYTESDTLFSIAVFTVTTIGCFSLIAWPLTRR